MSIPETNTDTAVPTSNKDSYAKLTQTSTSVIILSKSMRLKTNPANIINKLKHIKFVMNTLQLFHLLPEF